MINPKLQSDLSEVGIVRLAGSAGLILIIGVILSHNTGKLLSSGVSSSSASNISEKLPLDMEAATSAAEDNGTGTLSETSQSKSSVEISGNSVNINIDSSSTADVSNSDSSISVKIESNSSSNNSGTPGESAKPVLSINGEEVPLPKNGRVSETLKDGNTKTRLRADVDGEGSSSINISTKTN